MRRCIQLLAFAGIAHAAEIRPWTDVQNRTIEGRMLGLEGDSVILELKDGAKVLFPLSKLTAADADHARSQGGEGNFDAPWPDRIKFSEDPEIVVVEENAAEKRFVYESASYRYTCDVRLSKSVVKGFAVMFEATRLFCRSLPLGLDGGGGEGKLRIHLFETHEAYVEAGGQQDTAGIFLPGKSEVLVPLTSLGVRPVGSGYMLDRDKSSSTLPHELTHQLTPVAYMRQASMIWFIEGIAEYVAATPYRSGAFNVRNHFRDIVESVTGEGGRQIQLPALRAFMLQSHGDFMKEARTNYRAALLITCYFMQMDGEGDAKRLKTYLRALRKGKDREESLAALLDGRDFEELEKEIAKAWSRRGIDLFFDVGH
jgi:hypothetical protein